MRSDALSEAAVQIDGAQRMLHHRDTPADRGVLRQSFSDGLPRELKPRIFARRVAHRAAAILKSGRKPLILDLGANIGATALRLSALFPGTHIVAVEPHPDNVRLLRLNLEGMDVDVRQAAIGPEAGETHIVNPDASAWGYRTGDAGEGPAVPVLTIPDLIREKEAEGMTPLILKCDIEGAEADLFGPDSSWFDAFAMVSVEPHDWMMPDNLTANGFLHAHLRTPRSLLLNGENLISVAMIPPLKNRAR